MLTRRSVLGAAGAGLALAGGGWPRLADSRAAGAPVTPGVPAGVVDSAAMEALPGKKPLIRLAYRPPNYEAPLDYLRTPITRTTNSSSATTSPTFPTSMPRP